MTNKDKVAFYVGAALYKDLESDEVDRILQAAGLHPDVHSVAQCREAINKHLGYTPAGPVYDMDEIGRKIARQRNN